MNTIKCECGKEINKNAKFCSECGREIKKDKPDYLIIAIAVIAVIFIWGLMFMSNGKKIDKTTSEYQSFVESFETVISFYPEVTAYKVEDNAIVLVITDNSYLKQEKIANVIQTMAHNLGIINQNDNLTVKFYYNDKLSRSFY